MEELARIEGKKRVIMHVDFDYFYAQCEELRRPEIKIHNFKDLKNYPEEVLFETEVEVKYSPYIKRQLAEIKEFKNLERIKIPSDIDYNKIPGLSLEIKEKLSKFKPLNLGQASRISGITPSAISILMVYLKKLQSSEN